LETLVKKKKKSFIKRRVISLWDGGGRSYSFQDDLRRGLGKQAL
jgi:hypothetical protein